MRWWRSRWRRGSVQRSSARTDSAAGATRTTFSEEKWSFALARARRLGRSGVATSSRGRWGRVVLTRAVKGSGASGTALAVFYIVLWASAYVPSKIGATEAPPLWFLVARFGVAGLLMALLALAMRRRFPGSA